ncbi:MAG TPA: HI1506-related protein [Longimicrobium sp.]|jgi:hypothetical protein
MAETKHRVRTRSRSDAGFRRAGLRHTPEPQEFEVTAEQLESLLGEKQELVVEVLDGESDAAGAKKGAGK